MKNLEKNDSKKLFSDKITIILIKFENTRILHWLYVLNCHSHSKKRIKQIMSIIEEQNHIVQRPEALGDKYQDESVVSYMEKVEELLRKEAIEMATRRQGHYKFLGARRSVAVLISTRTFARTTGAS